LGEYGETEFTPGARSDLLPKLQEIYRSASDPGLHAACEWLLRRWQQNQWLSQVNETWAKGEVAGGAWRVEGKGKLVAPPGTRHPSPGWYVNTQGQTMVVIPGPVEFVMGSPVTEVGRGGAESQRKMRIGRSFALAAKTVTLEEYRRLKPRYGVDRLERWARTPDSPAIGTSWFEAVEYCNWLSKQEGLPESEWCYEPLVDLGAWPRFAVSTFGLLQPPAGQGPFLALSGMDPRRFEPKYEVGMKVAPNCLERQGYRLPTNAEMEYAIRAGAVTARYYGETDELLPKYAWYNKNSQERTWPIGSLKPNDFGLFDALGNAWTWYQEAYKPSSESIRETDESPDDLVVTNAQNRAAHGGSFLDPAARVRAASRVVEQPTNHSGQFSFRPARTLPLGSFTPLPSTANGGQK
jgi:formylglycine-generating enzyme required for sulfatase activity